MWKPRQNGSGAIRLRGKRVLQQPILAPELFVPHFPPSRKHIYEKPTIQPSGWARGFSAGHSLSQLAERSSLHGKRLSQPSVLGLCLFQSGDIGVGVFPDCEEVFVHGTGLGSVALQRVGASQSEAGERSPRKSGNEPGMINELLEFSRCPVTVVQCQIG